MPYTATLHFLCGKAGAGKSSLAVMLAEARQATLISEDVWLSRLFAQEMKTFDDYRRFSQRLKEVVGPLVIDLLASRRNVVLDYPANTRASRAWFLALAGQAGAAHVLHYLETSDQTCLQRIGQRNVERPEGSHHLTEADFLHISSFFEPPQPDEGLRIEVHGEGGAQSRHVQTLQGRWRSC